MSTANEKTKNNSQEQDYEIDTLTNERLISDHEYDGIRELDNDLPPWWKWLFYITIVFAIVYMVRLFVFQADDLVQQTEYDQEMAQVASLAPTTSQTGTFELKVLTDQTSLANGKAIFDKICSVCHLIDGGGLVGPNMTDDYWIHGNTLENLFNTVTNGVLEKGMVPYKDQYSPTQRLEVISYILTLHGTTPATPKAPQGELREWPY
jgi:cytochrome c oxidase cbb3-type subunit III